LTVRNPWTTYTGTDPKYVVRMAKLIEMLSCESLFIPLRLSTHRSIKSFVRVNPQGRSVEKVKLLLNGSHLEPQVVRPQRHRGDDGLEQRKPKRKELKPPSYHIKCQSGL
jgi:hypothetical protein